MATISLGHARALASFLGRPAHQSRLKRELAGPDWQAPGLSACGWQ